MTKQKKKSKKFIKLCKQYGVNHNLVPEILTYEDACQATKRDPKALPQGNGLSKEDVEYLQEHYKSIVIADAIRGDYKPDFSDDNYKYEPRFYMNSSGSGFAYAYCDGWTTGTDCGSRLCFPNPDQAIFYGKHFVNQHGKWMMKGK